MASILLLLRAGALLAWLALAPALAAQTRKLNAPLPRLPGQVREQWVTRDGTTCVFLANPEHQAPSLFSVSLTRHEKPVALTAPVRGDISPSGVRISPDGARVVFTSNGDLVPGENTDHNREIFVFDKGVLSQLTHSTGAVESVNPHINSFGRFVVFESTAQLVMPDDDQATNRRVYLADRKRGTILRLSRSRFGDNFVPRVSKGRFVVWESTANLTGENPSGDRVIYLFDRRRDD